MAGESELATATGEGIGRIDSSKNINWCGILLVENTLWAWGQEINNLK